MMYVGEKFLEQFNIALCREVEKKKIIKTLTADQLAVFKSQGEEINRLREQIKALHAERGTGSFNPFLGRG